MARLAILVGTLLLLSGMAAAQDGVDAKGIYDKKCKLCHSLQGEKGKKADLGGPLDDVGSKRDEAWLREYFKNPKSKIEGSKMPKIKLSDAEWDAMVKYLLAQKGPVPKAAEK